MRDVLQPWGTYCSLAWGGGGGGGGGGLVTGMGTCRGGGGGELDILTQMAGGVALSISLRYSCIEYHYPLGLMVSTVTLLHDI